MVDSILFGIVIQGDRRIVHVASALAARPDSLTAFSECYFTDPQVEIRVPFCHRDKTTYGGS